jgi:acyl-CoA ligase (AMP-forming) (exosortase A-associated)
MSQLLHQLIESAASKHPDAEAISYRGKGQSYADLYGTVETVAAGLQQLGLHKGERVAIYLPKQDEAVVAFFGIALAGGIFVPINPLLKSSQVAHILNDCGANLLITSRDRAKLLTPILSECKDLKQVILVDSDEESLADIVELYRTVPWQQLLDSDPVKSPVISSDDNVAILYTSGSTGKPKGVVLSHHNMVIGAQSVAQYLGTRNDDRILAVLPFSFDYGLSQLTTAFHTGASVVLMNYLLPQDVLRAVSKERITTLAGVPSLWMQLAPLAWPKDATEQLRTITNSGGHLPTPIIDSLRERLPATQLFLMYGLTEAFRSSYLPPEELAARPTSMGKAIPHAKLAVVRPDGSQCDPGEPGELVHAGPLVAQGYWNAPEKTERHFRPPPIAMANHNPAERVLWSGDTVTMDENGYLYFVGREDDMIKTSGYRVSPTEVEEVVHATGLVSEVAVLGVPHPTLGQAIVVIAVPKAETEMSGSTLSEQILLACKVALPAFMLPLHIELRAQLPKTPNGKIERQLLKQEFQGRFVDTP